MKEIELKKLEINPEFIESKILALGGLQTFEGKLIAIYFDYEDSSFRNKKNTLRLRKEGEKSFLTFKQFVESNDVKIREENQVEVSDFNTTFLILKGLGYLPKFEIKKYRKSFSINNEIHIEIDTHTDNLSFIPTLMEFEASDVEILYRYIKLFGYEKKDLVDWNAFELIKHYSKIQNISC